MKYIITIVFLLLPLYSKESKIKILVMKPVPSSLLVQTLFNECENCSNKELLVVLDVIKNRVKHPDFPNTIDKVLIQKNQFDTSTTKPYTTSIKKSIDTLFIKPITTPYLYFLNWKGAKKAPWMYKKKRNWIKIGQMHYSV